MGLCVVSNCCPTGCGVPVVVLQARASRIPFCFCDLCGCAWATPGEAQVDAGLNSVTGPQTFAPSGVDPIARSQLAQGVWFDAVIAEIPESDWTSISDINAAIATACSR
jgi:hypothetical protein